ncbi:MAG: poly(A) polymerase [Thermodesulfobacteriota bacterium]|nr:poly(A) polymerase [Thermodesulfobacteriota bacterium]
MTENGKLTPLIVPSSEHPLSRKNIDRDALTVLNRLRDAGFISYLVGGCVRDLYLGNKPKDFDISTEARPGQVRKLFRNSRVIGRRFRLVQVFFKDDKIIEVSTFRRAGEYDLKGLDKVLPSNNTFGNASEDAFRRDLTINALFCDIDKFSIIDYAGGMADIKNGIVRMVGDPDRRITRDPVRMMRVIRHAARNNFIIEKNTWDAVRHHCKELTLCPPSRIYDELFKDLRGGAVEKWAGLAIECGLFFVIFPCYKNLISDDEKSLEKASSKAGGKGALSQLLDIFRVIDRLHAQARQIPDHMIMSLILMPWAEAEKGLTSVKRKGREAFIFSRELRAYIGSAFSHLNIKRAMIEGITTLLSNFPAFQQHEKDHSWPAWFKKKSYFQEGLLFYGLCCESQGGKKVGSQMLPAFSRQKRKPAKHSSGRGNRGPAFDIKSKGGVFGFKKK